MPKTTPNGVRLTPDEVKEIKENQAKLERTKVEIAALKKMGLDTRALDDKIEWSDEAAKTLLDVFGKE